MSGLGAPTPTVIQAQIAALQNNNFLTQQQKNDQINALTAQLSQVTKSGYTGNVSTAPPTNPSSIFAAQQALTQALGARAAAALGQPTSPLVGTPPSLGTLNQYLTQQGVYVTSPELQSFNNLIQNVPLQPSQAQSVTNLLSRINSPIITSGSSAAPDLANFLVKSGALNPNPTPNTTSVMSSPAAGGGYQPPSNLPQVSIPAGYGNLPTSGSTGVNLGAFFQPQAGNPILGGVLTGSPNTQQPNINIQPPNVTVNIPQLPSSPPAGGGTSSGGASGSGITVPSTGGFDLMGFINSIITNPILLIGAIAIIGILFFVFLVPRNATSYSKKTLIASR